MSCHAIIGRGNLGLDLQKVLEQRGETVHVLTRSEGFHWPHSLEDLKKLEPDYIWITAGGGSVESAQRDFGGTVATHTSMPLEIMRSFHDNVKIILFSSDYCANEEFPNDSFKRTTKPRSLYAMSKIWMEEGFEFLNRPNTCIIRVGSLYGKWYYQRSFPGKLVQRYPEPEKIVLPTNIVVPTLTAWVAEVVVKHVDFLMMSPTKKIYHCAPKGNISVLNFGRMILGAGYQFESRGIDPSRPEKSGLGCNFFEDAPNWEELWKSNWWV